MREWGWRMVSTGLAILAVLSVLAAVGYVIIGHDNGTDTTIVLPFFLTGIASALICAGLALVTNEAAQRKQ